MPASSISKQGIRQVFTPKPRTRHGLTTMGDLGCIEDTQTHLESQEAAEAADRLRQGFSVRTARPGGGIRVTAPRSVDA